MKALSSILLQVPMLSRLVYQNKPFAKHFMGRRLPPDYGHLFCGWITSTRAPYV